MQYGDIIVSIVNSMSNDLKNTKELQGKTSVQITKETRLKLGKLGTLSSTYDSIINGLVEHAYHCDRYWNDKK